MALHKIWSIGTKAEMELAETAFENIGREPLALSRFEDEGTSWRLDVLYNGPSKLADILMELVVFDGSLKDIEIFETRLKDENWVLKSLEGLAPINAGRFFVHGLHDADKKPAGSIPIIIEAGEAFGTGHHGTTEGCLVALSQIAEHETPEQVLDLGTGTGLLAIGAAKLWRVPIIGTDIDPIAVRVAHENAILNGVGQQIRMVQAAGTTHALIHEKAPYDLICANILAKPLRQLAGDITDLLAPGGLLVLSGLLDDQDARVAATYRGHHMTTQTRLAFGEWVTLIMRKD